MEWRHLTKQTDLQTYGLQTDRDWQVGMWTCMLDITLAVVCFWDLSDAATYARYCITFLVFSVLPAPDSPLATQHTYSSHRTTQQLSTTLQQLAAVIMITALDWDQMVAGSTPSHSAFQRNLVQVIYMHICASHLLLTYGTTQMHSYSLIIYVCVCVMVIQVNIWQNCLFCASSMLHTHSQLRAEDAIHTDCNNLHLSQRLHKKNICECCTYVHKMDWSSRSKQKIQTRIFFFCNSINHQKRTGWRFHYEAPVW